LAAGAATGTVAAILTIATTVLGLNADAGIDAAANRDIGRHRSADAQCRRQRGGGTQHCELHLGVLSDMPFQPSENDPPGALFQ
jgi:hypothetical protein